MHKKGGFVMALVKEEQIFKFLVQSYAQDKRQLGCGVKLPGLNRADGVAGNAYHFGKLGLGQLFFTPGFFKTIFQYKRIFHAQ